MDGNYEWLNVRTVARRSEVDETTVKRWCRRRLVDAVKLPGGQWRIRCTVGGFPLRRKTRPK